MAIFTGRSAGPVQLQGTGGDTTLLTDTDRTLVTALALKNNASVQAVINLYISPTSASAGGEKVSTVTIAPGNSRDAIDLIGQGIPADSSVIANIATSGIGLGEVISTLTYTEYTESS